MFQSCTKPSPYTGTHKAIHLLCLPSRAVSTPELFAPPFLHSLSHFLTLWDSMASLKNHAESSDWLLDGSDKVYRNAEASERPGNEPSWRQPSFVVFSWCIVFACLVVGFTLGQYATSSQLGKYEQILKHPKACNQPALRKEWRSLERIEKLSYIEAVRCLKSFSSQLGLNQSLYDDFPWVHMHYGETCMSYTFNARCW